MSTKTMFPMMVCGLLAISACKNEQHTVPPTEPTPADPGAATIEDELAPAEDPEEMRSIPEGEDVEEYRRDDEEDLD